MVTSKQIAELAGVSRGTVDRVLNNREGVKPETQQRVQEIARQLGYTPNRAGKALSTSRKPLSLGIVLNCVGIDFYDEMLRGIDESRKLFPDFNIQCHERHLKGYSVEEQIEALREVTEEGAQTVILTPIDDPEVANAINQTVDSGIPVITLNNDIEGTKRMLHVGCDYVASGRTAGGLIGLILGGKGSVGVVIGSERMLGHRRRVEGFLSELRERFPLMSVPEIVESRDDDIRAYGEVKELLTRKPYLSALYFAAAGAYGGVQAAMECCDRHLPLIITSDDVPKTRELIRSGPICATICQQPYRQGYEAVREAIEALITGKPPAKDTLFMENQIKIRQNLD